MANASDTRPRLYSAAQVRDLDARAIRDLPVPGYTLMQRAAQASFDVLRARWPEAGRIAVLCGPGNNGGDGFEIARLARAAGLFADVRQVGPAATAGDAVTARQAWIADGGTIDAFAPEGLAHADVLVDAIFGIGITREVTGEPRAAIEALNARLPGQGVLAVDVPSGLDSDRGTIHGAAVSADVTISFIGRKFGLYTGQGPDVAGDRVFASLGVPDALTATSPALADLLGAADIALALPRRARSSHKGRHGHVLLVGGDEGMSGAILLAARGALRSGAGLVSVATRASHAATLTAAQPEAMVRGVERPRDLRELVERCDVVAIGPGLGQRDWARALFADVLACGKPLVLDADALNLLSERDPPRLPAGGIVTPHPGEAARLLRSRTSDVQGDRLTAVRELAARTGSVAVLKGAGTLIHGPAGTGVCPFGNPGMGVGGAGDVLTGVTAAMVGQGLDPETAARTAVLVHARAGDLAATAKGERGLLPSDLVDALREAVNP